MSQEITEWTRWVIEVIALPVIAYLFYSTRSNYKLVIKTEKELSHEIETRCNSFQHMFNQHVLENEKEYSALFEKLSKRNSKTETQIAEMRAEFKYVIATLQRLEKYIEKK